MNPNIFEEFAMPTVPPIVPPTPSVKKVILFDRKQTEEKEKEQTEEKEKERRAEEEKRLLKELSTEQQDAYKRFKQGKNLFITGPGGVGKTKLIKHLVRYAKIAEKKVQVCAMTGCAALLLHNRARTLHSWSGIRLAKGDPKKVIEDVLRNKKAKANWKRIDCLILDEVSMLSKKIFNIIEEVARRVRKDPAPFGGIQVVMTGDFFQLPPVGTDGEPDTEAFCFESANWTKVFSLDNHVQLKTIFRQTDPVYIKILQEIRKGTLSEKSKQVLQNRLNCPQSDPDRVPTKLFPLRSKTDNVNRVMFSKLPDKEETYHLVQKTDCSTIVETSKPLSLDAILRSDNLSAVEKEYELNQLISSSPCNLVLRLKKGAAVMCTTNLDLENGICNGSQGIVQEFLPDDKNNLMPVVRFTNGQIRQMTPHVWQSEDYPKLAISQVPLSLAWALTIHKIQGATLSLAEIDIGQGIFEYGQTYVALSRVQSLDGLYLSAFQPQNIRANPKVIKFYQTMDKYDEDCKEDAEDRFVMCEECSEQVDCFKNAIHIVYKGTPDKITEDLTLCTMCFQSREEELRENGYKCDDWTGSECLEIVNDEKDPEEPIQLCENMDCERFPPDWDFEEDTEETYEEDQWKKCCLCDGYFDDNGMGDILYVQEEPNKQEAECSLCGKSEDIVQMKGCGQYLCGNACDEEEEETSEEEEEKEGVRTIRF